MATNKDTFDFMPPPDRLALGDEAAHVWRIDLAGEGERADECKRLLSDDERARAARFHFDRHRRHYIVGRATLRRIVAAYLALAPDEVVFRYGPQGKPELSAREGPRLEFNLSHSADLALCVVARWPVGVDLERLREVPDADLIAARFFTPAEVAVQRAAADRDAAFLRHWTRKEAVIKAVGVGLSMPLDTFDLSSLGRSPIRLAEDSDGVDNAWHVVDIGVAPGYVAAMALARAPRAIVRLDAAFH